MCMTNDLRGLLEGQSVPTDMITYSSSVGCFDIGFFSDWIDSKDVDYSVQRHILDHCSEDTN